MRIPICSAVTTNLDIAATRYVNLWAHGTPAWQSSNGNTNRGYIYRPWTLTNLVVDLGTAPGVGISRTFTIQKNGVDTGLTVTISGSSTQATVYGTVSGVSGDYVHMKQVVSGVATSAGVARWATTLDLPDNIFTVSHSNGNSASTASRTYWFPVGQINVAIPTTEDQNTRIIFPGAYTLKSMYFTVGTAPGAGKQWTFSVYKNGAEEVSTRVVLSGTNTSVSITGLSLSLSATDTISLSALPGSTPASWISINSTLEFQPDVAGESFMAASPLAMLTTNNYYFRPMMNNLGASTTESTMQLIAPLDLDFWCKDFYGKLTVAPGAGGSGKKRVFTVRKNGADVNNTFTILETATSGSDTTHFDKFTALDYISWQEVPTATPSSTAGNFACTIYIPPTPLIFE